MSGAGGWLIAIAVLAAVYGFYSLSDRVSGAIGDKIEDKLDRTLNRRLPIDEEDEEGDR